MLTAIADEDLQAVVDEVFGLMAGMDLLPSATLMEAQQGDESIVSAVQIVGEWQGAVRLDIDLELARQACAKLLGVDRSELSMEDIRDAAGEFANITGGSIKALCAPTARLSLPTVVIGRDFNVSMSQGTVIQAMSFSHSSGAMTVSVIEKENRRDDDPPLPSV
jgi:CheY-specific phosphatase CheX